MFSKSETMAKKRYTVSVTIIGRKHESPLEAVNEMIDILNDDARYLTYDVVDEDTHEKFTVEITEENIVKVKLTGDCENCPMSTLTLRAGIERALMNQVPGIRRIESVN